MIFQRCLIKHPLFLLNHLRNPIVSDAIRFGDVHQRFAQSDTTVEAFADMGYTVLDPSPESAFVVLDNHWLV